MNTIESLKHPAIDYEPGNGGMERALVLDWRRVTESAHGPADIVVCQTREVVNHLVVRYLDENAWNFEAEDFSGEVVPFSLEGFTWKADNGKPGILGPDGLPWFENAEDEDYPDGLPLKTSAYDGEAQDFIRGIMKPVGRFCAMPGKDLIGQIILLPSGTMGTVEEIDEQGNTDMIIYLTGARTTVSFGEQFMSGYIVFTPEEAERLFGMARDLVEKLIADNEPEKREAAV